MSSSSGSGRQYGWFPPPSKPRAVAGGIKARTARGEIAKSWWSRRFIEVLTSFGVGSRLTRGRTYARKGQVIDLTVDAGVVTAAVQGSRARPYRVRIGLVAFGKAEWGAVTDALADDAWYAARLLAGEMPDDIEEVFERAGLSLFPESKRDLSMDCTCPDWEVPCKHLAAVFYLLAERFDADPFEILMWRGRGKQDLLDALGALRAGATPGDARRGDVDGGDGGAVVVPLSECLADFFRAPAAMPPRAVAQSRPDALLDQLPPVPVVARGKDVRDLLRPLYRAFAEGGD